MTARILVVDDDVALAEMISIVLRGEGYTPVQAFDGQAALAHLADSTPDLILLDVMLPGLDGIEVCARIRETSGVPIIMLTAKGDTTDVVRGSKAELMTMSSNLSTPRNWSPELRRDCAPQLMALSRSSLFVM